MQAMCQLHRRDGAAESRGALLRRGRGFANRSRRQAIFGNPSQIAERCGSWSTPPSHTFS
jgi:hypothetical protein